MKLTLLFVAAVYFALPYAADASEALLGRYALEEKWNDSAKGACRSVDAAMAQRLASSKFHCPTGPVSGTASGRPAVVCKGDRVEVLVFQTRADCEQEIRANKANND